MATRYDLHIMGGPRHWERPVCYSEAEATSVANAALDGGAQSILMARTTQNGNVVVRFLMDRRRRYWRQAKR